MRRVGPGRQRQGHDRSARQRLRRPAQPRLSDAAAAQHGLHRFDDVRGARTRLASVSRSGVDQFTQLPGPGGVHVSRLLQQGRLPRRREERAPPDHDPARPGDRPPEGGHARARHLDRYRCRRPRDGCHLRDRRAGVCPARESRPARQLHLREHAATPALEIEGVSERPVEQSRPGRASLPEPRAGRQRDRALPLQHQRVVRPARAGRGRGQLRRRQLRSRRARLHWRRQPVGDVGSPPDLGGEHGHVRAHAVVGIRLEGVRDAQCRSHQHVVPAEDDAALRRQLPRSRSRGEGSARLPRVPHHRRLQGQRAARQRDGAGKNDRVVQGRGRHRHAVESHRHDGSDDARVRWHADGPQSRNERRQ